MPPEDRKNDLPDGRGVRLRIDASKVDVARLRLAAVDRVVFGAERKHAVGDHDRLVKETVMGLFGHG